MRSDSSINNTPKTKLSGTTSDLAFAVDLSAAQRQSLKRKQNISVVLQSPVYLAGETKPSVTM